MFSIWFWYFFLIIAFTLCFCIFDNTINVRADNLIILLPFICYLMFFSCMLEYIIVIIFNGSESEAFVTLLLTVLTALAINGAVGQLKNINQHENLI